MKSTLTTAALIAVVGLGTTLASLAQADNGDEGCGGEGGLHGERTPVHPAKRVCVQHYHHPV